MVLIMVTFLLRYKGAWHFVMVGVFQHASMAQDVLDHRINTRTSVFLYFPTSFQSGSVLGHSSLAHFDVTDRRDAIRFFWEFD